MSNPIRWATTHFLASFLARRTNKPVVAPDDALTGARGNIWDVRVAVRRASRRLSPFAMALGIYSFPSAGSLGTPMQARQSSSIAHRPAARSDRGVSSLGHYQAERDVVCVVSRSRRRRISYAGGLVGSVQADSNSKQEQL